MPEQVQRYGRQLTAQEKDERRQDNSDKKRLTHQHPSDLLHSLTCEWDRWKTAWRRPDSTLNFAILSDRIFHVLSMRHMMRMCIPSSQYHDHLFSYGDSNVTCNFDHLFSLWVTGSIVTSYLF